MISYFILSDTFKFKRSCRLWYMISSLSCNEIPHGERIMPLMHSISSIQCPRNTLAWKNSYFNYWISGLSGIEMTHNERFFKIILFDLRINSICEIYKENDHTLMGFNLWRKRSRVNQFFLFYYTNHIYFWVLLYVCKLLILKVLLYN